MLLEVWSAAVSALAVISSRSRSRLLLSSSSLPSSLCWLRNCVCFCEEPSLHHQTALAHHHRLLLDNSTFFCFAAAASARNSTSPTYRAPNRVQTAKSPCHPFRTYAMANFFLLLALFLGSPLLLAALASVSPVIVVYALARAFLPVPSLGLRRMILGLVSLLPLICLPRALPLAKVD